MVKLPHIPDAVDYVLFQGLIGTMGVAHSLLLTSGTPWETVSWFYIVMWLASMVILILCRLFYHDVDQFEYWKPLSQSKLFYVLGGFLAVLFVSSILLRAFTKSSASIWVPQPQMALAIGTLSLSSIMNDLFFQVALVCNSEETLILAFSQIVRKKVATTSYFKYAVPIAIGIPRAGWALLHAYVSYTGALMPILVLSAFISGVIMSYAFYKTKSFMVALLIHFGFNGAIVILNAIGV
jgi:membrane protease YdiL (CAAX protease family)